MRPRERPTFEGKARPGAAEDAAIRTVLQREARELFDESTTDPMGSLIATKRAKQPGAKKVLLACHIDEISRVSPTGRPSRRSKPGLA